MRVISSPFVFFRYRIPLQFNLSEDGWFSELTSRRRAEPSTDDIENYFSAVSEGKMTFWDFVAGLMDTFYDSHNGLLSIPMPGLTINGRSTGPSRLKVVFPGIVWRPPTDLDVKFMIEV